MFLLSRSQRVFRRNILQGEKTLKLYSKIIHSEFGTLKALSSEKGIVLLEFENGQDVQKEYSEIEKILDSKITDESNVYLDCLEKELSEYFSGQRKVFTLPLDLLGTDFQISVWKALLEIPYGRTKTYHQQSEFLGNTKAIRAVGTANGKNRIAILVPCHRVIGKDGSLVGYRGGIEIKKKLLGLERKNSGEGTLF